MSSVSGLTMPKWGLSMTAGKVVRWLVDEGAEVSPSVELAEIETDKILGSLEASATGVLLRKVARADDVVPVAGLLGVIGDASTPEEQIDSFISDFQARFVIQKANTAVAFPLSEAVAVMGQPIRYLKRGESEEAVILIHGFGGDLNSWLFNQEDLAQGRAVYSLDLPGHGGSSKQVGNGTVKEFAEVLNAFMDTVGLSRVDLVGHSMGGAVALEFALDHPERSRSLVLIASAGLGPEINSEFIDGFIAASRRKDIKPHLDKLFADARLVGRQLVEDVLKYKRLDGVELALRTVAKQFFPGGRQAVELRDRLGRLLIPIMVIWGTEDRILPVSHAHSLPESVRIEIIPGGGHMVQMEAAITVNQLIHSFWKSKPKEHPSLGS